MSDSQAWRISLLVFSIAGVATPADWDKNQFPNWSEETLLRIVTDSPWAKVQKVDLTWRKRDEPQVTYKDIPGTSPRGASAGAGPLGGIGAPKPKLPQDADLIIRWAGALPVRQAIALYRQRHERPEIKNPSDLISAPQDGYVIEIFGVPAEVAHSGTESVEAIVQQSAWLRTKAGRTLRPSRVEAKLNGLNLTVLIHFPGREPFRLDDKEIECYADFQVFSVREKFKLSPMVYLGHLEI